MSKLVELVAVSKQFGGRTAVDRLSLTVPRGGIFGLLGHNGAGKSTAIGMMLGQVWPSGGQVMICGFEVARHRQQALHRVGAIFETPAFYDYLSGWRNLEILSRYSARTSADRIREVLDWVGLSGREHGKVRTYSHGMRARLAIAQALLPNPELLILDEPSNGLDPEGIHEMRQTILRLHRELDLTILLSSHLLNEVQQICTRIAVLHQGRKVFEGSLAEATRKRGWIRLRVGAFDAATEQLRGAGLITDSRDGRWIQPSPGTGTDQIVKWLVHAGFAVHEIAPEDETLEAFYLDLMEEERRALARPADDEQMKTNG